MSARVVTDEDRQSARGTRPTVTLRRDGQVSTIELSRVHSRNALNVELVRDLHSVLDEVEADTECRVVILTGAGDSFCVGLDLRGYGDDRAVEERGPMVSTFERQQRIAGLAQRIHGLRQPVVAAVNGAAAGGGLALVCASDIRIGSSAAVFAVGFLRAGFSACDIGVSWFLPRLLGPGRAHELMLTGRKFTADDARTYGLLIDVVAPEKLLQAATEIAHQILASPPLSVEMTKVGMWAALESPSLTATVEFENRQQMVTAMTEDRDEAAAAFLDKRAPTYRRR